MAFFKPRSPKNADTSGAGQPPAPELASAPAADILTRRARHRLIGAAILVVAAVIGLPWLLNAAPPPVAPNIPIVMQGKSDTSPPAVPASDTTVAAVKPATPVTPVPAQVALNSSLGDREQVVDANTPESARQTPAAQTAALATAPPQRPATATPQAARVAQTTASKPTPSRRDAAAEAARTAPREQAAQPAPAAEPDSIDALIAQRQAQENASAKPPTPENKPAVTANFPEKGRFVVQVGAYVEDAKLAGVRQKLNKAGLPHFTQRVTLNGKSVMRVRMGPFTTRKQMEQTAAKVRALGLPVSQYQL